MRKAHDADAKPRSLVSDTPARLPHSDVDVRLVAREADLGGFSGFSFGFGVQSSCSEVCKARAVRAVSSQVGRRPD